MGHNDNPEPRVQDIQHHEKCTQRLNKIKEGSQKSPTYFVYKRSSWLDYMSSFLKENKWKKLESREGWEDERSRSLSKT